MLATLGVPNALILIVVPADTSPKLASPPPAIAVTEPSASTSPTAIVSAVRSASPSLSILPSPGVLAPICPLVALISIEFGDMRLSKSTLAFADSRIEFASKVPIAMLCAASRLAMPPTVIVPFPVMSPTVEVTVKAPPIVPASRLTLVPDRSVSLSLIALPTLTAPVASAVTLIASSVPTSIAAASSKMLLAATMLSTSIAPVISRSTVLLEVVNRVSSVPPVRSPPTVILMIAAARSAPVKTTSPGASMLIEPPASSEAPLAMVTFCAELKSITAVAARSPATSISPVFVVTVKLPPTSLSMSEAL